MMLWIILNALKTILPATTKVVVADKMLIMPPENIHPESNQLAKDCICGTSPELIFENGYYVKCPFCGKPESTIPSPTVLLAVEKWNNVISEYFNKS